MARPKIVAEIGCNPKGDFAFDIDGVMTDNRVVLDQSGSEAGLVLASEGGRGATRELAEYLLAQRLPSRS